MLSTSKCLIAATAILTLGFLSTVHADEVKVMIENLSPNNGTWLTPFWVGFHNGSFDVYDLNMSASEELEHLAEDGNAQPLSDSFTMSGFGNVQGVIMTGDTLPPFAPGEMAEMTFTLDGNDPMNHYFSFGSMVIPSNDAFIGNDSPMAHRIFDDNGNFHGASFIVYGADVLDAGTEVNDEIPMNTAFFGQTMPNTGVDENGVVHIHPGYMPPDSGGILADPMFANADFTQPGYEVAQITIVRTDVAVNITMTPTNPPIVIPASGGSFMFNAQLANNETGNVNSMAWIMVQLPDSSMYGPVLGPLNLMLAGGSSIARDRSQNVPAAAPPGMYVYTGYLGIYPNTIWSQDSFTFEKSTTGNANPVNGWENSGQSFETETAELSSNVPAEYRLNGAYPNPFNPTTTIGYALPEAARVSLTVYDVNGRTVATLVNGYRDAGVHEVTFDASSLASGVYVYRLSANQFSAVGKMVLMK